MRTMYDAVTPSNIPADAQMVAGYVDGRYAWSAADWARFPNAVKVRIACFASTNDGHVLDVERGDATPAQAVGWVQMRRAAGVDPTVYCGYSTNGYSWALVINAFKTAGVPEPHYWVAAYPGNGAQLYAGSVAHQYADPITSGGNWDLSVVADYWPGVDDPSTVSNILSALPVIAGEPGSLTATPPIPTVQEDDMRIISAPLPWDGTKRQQVWVTPSGGAGTLDDATAGVLRQTWPSHDLDSWDALQTEVREAWTRQAAAQGKDLTQADVQAAVEAGVRTVLGSLKP